MILLITALFVVFYIFATKKHDYWKKRNVKHDKPLPFVGNHFKNAAGFRSMTQVLTDLYTKYPEEKVVGYYKGNEPELILRDLGLVRDILNVDFLNFHARGAALNPETDPLQKNLFHVDGDIWKLLRKRLTPAFTSTRLKNMFPLIVNCAEKLQKLGDDKCGENCDVRDLMARFNTEVIGVCGFGIEMDTICNENSPFTELGKTMFSRNQRDVILLAIMDFFPETKKHLLYYTMSDNKMYTIIAHMVQTALKQRNYKPSSRNDFIDILLISSQQGKIIGESIEHRHIDGTPVIAELELDDDLLFAQVFVFYAAGFETSSTATSTTLYNLAFHPHIQARVQQEIDEVLQKYNGKLCYEAINKMTLLDMVLQESMRLFPSLGFLQRVCVKRYTFPSLGLTIDPGVKVLIPIQAIQMDEKYFENPSEFRPERFSPESMNHQKYSYLPFGEGPRGCIGESLSLSVEDFFKYIFEKFKKEI